MKNITRKNSRGEEFVLVIDKGELVWKKLPPLPGELVIAVPPGTPVKTEPLLELF